MPFCSNCAHPVGDEARYCSNCANPLPAAGEGQVPGWKVETAGLDDVPSWLGWLAIPITLLTSIIGLGLYSYWAYRRGRREGVGREPTVQPYDSFGWRVVGWGLAGFVPVLGWYAAVHLPTICYKQGLRVGAREGTAFERFTSLPALGAAFGGMAVVALAALFIASVALALTEDEDGGEPVRVVPQRATPTPSFTEADVLELAQNQISEQVAFPGETEWVRCRTASYRSGNSLWLVTCGFYLTRFHRLPEYDETYRFDDRTGELIP